MHVYIIIFNFLIKTTSGFLVSEFKSVGLIFDYSFTKYEYEN